jgi:hypothetical protein
MLRGDAHPGRFLANTDFMEDTLATIREIAHETVMDDGESVPVWVMYLQNPSNANLDISRGIRGAPMKFDMVAQITGEPDSDNWAGHEIVIYRDPNQRNPQGVVTGGIKFRAVKRSAPATVEEPPPPTATDDVPF